MYIVVDYRKDGKVDYVCALPGWTWTINGCRQEVKGFRGPSPEWTPKRDRALSMKRLTAMRIANQINTAVVQKG